METEINNIQVTKASGVLAPFSEEKLRHSLLKCGAESSDIERFSTVIQTKLYPGISTKKIYQLAFGMLKNKGKYLAARYHLKRGIMELGPSGYPFERFVAELFNFQGFSTKVGEIVNGKCVKHEIDVIAEKENHHFMIECKYHNQPGNVCDVKIPLYIQARFKDVESQWLLKPGHSTKLHQGWVVTNTRFSGDAEKYGCCAGLLLLGWDFPQKDSLKALIDRFALYPLTCLTSLTKAEKHKLLNKKIVLCKELCKDESKLTNIGISPTRIKIILEEGHQLCKGITINGK